MLSGIKLIEKGCIKARTAELLLIELFPKGFQFRPDLRFTVYIVIYLISNFHKCFFFMKSSDSLKT